MELLEIVGLIRNLLLVEGIICIFIFPSILIFGIPNKKLLPNSDVRRIILLGGTSVGLGIALFLMYFGKVFNGIIIIPISFWMVSFVIGKNILCNLNP